LFDVHGSAHLGNAHVWLKVQLDVCGLICILYSSIFLFYEGCPVSIQPFWISRLLFVWPWWILAASQMRPYCASMNSHSPMGLVSWQWDSVDWACVMCDRRIHNDWASRTASSRQCACPFCNSRAGFSGAKIPSRKSLSTLTAQMWLPATSKAKIAFASKEICYYDDHTVHKLSQRRLTANWLALWESDCSPMHSKVSSDWLPSYIKVTPTVLEIFKMARYFPDSPRTCFGCYLHPSSGAKSTEYSHRCVCNGCGMLVHWSRYCNRAFSCPTMVTGKHASRSCTILSQGVYGVGGTNWKVSLFIYLHIIYYST
jgi:hypothetical protein